MVPLSVLDLSPITEGGDAGQALRNSLDLARHVEALGYRRFWMAEHHNLPGIASAATAVALAHVASGTSRIRIGDVDQFPQDVVELMRYFRPEPGQQVHAIPGEGLDVPIWILGSSTYGAQLAAILGLPYAFASHFAPAMLLPAIEMYRQRFRPSEQLAAPHV